jgi:hypothetical protein
MESLTVAVIGAVCGVSGCVFMLLGCMCTMLLHGKQITTIHIIYNPIRKEKRQQTMYVMCILCARV